MDATQSPTRTALIVANWQFKDTKLKQLVAPPQDAQNLVRVLRDRAIGGFEVKLLLNKPSHDVRRAIQIFFKADRKRNDLLLLYFSSHGIKDEQGLLYFATTDTELELLDSTAVSAEFINRQMGRSKSKRQVLLLDCCYSGAFARGLIIKATDKAIDIKERFEGRGRYILTASNSMQYAFEEDRIVEREVVQSVFTHSLVQGLEKLNDDGTWEADRNKDGCISLDELYDYVYEHVVNQTQNKQTPRKWALDVEGEIAIAQNCDRAAKAIELPASRAVELPTLPLATLDEIKELCADVVHKITSDSLVFFLGWDINLYGRSPELNWQPDRCNFLPSISEFSAYLSKEFDYPLFDEQQDFSRVSQFIVDKGDIYELWFALNSLIDRHYPPTPLHHFFAKLPDILASHAYSPSYPLIITTNYDDALERAFRECDQPFDLVSYVARGEERGQFVHCFPDGKTQVISDPEMYDGISFEERPVILKICGTITPTDSDLNGFVVGGDLAHFDYIDVRSLPIKLVAKLRRNGLLFLGCRSRDWNLRNLLRRLYGEHRVGGRNSWWIEPSPRILDKPWLNSCGIRVFSARLEEFLTELANQLENLYTLPRPRDES